MGSECLIGGSAVASGCVVTSQQPVLQIPGSGSGNVYISDGSSPDQSNAWVSPAITLSPNSACGGNTCYTVPAGAGLLPRHSYQWTFVPSGGGNNLTWQGFTIDYVRTGREPTDSFGPLTVGLASGTVQTKLQTQAVQTASGTVQIGLSYRSGYNGTPTGKPWFPEDPADSLPVGWVFTGVDANVPWVRISAVDGVGGSGTSAVTLQAFDGSLLEYTNTAGGSGGWAPPVGVGRPANDYGSLSQSTDGSTFTWTSGTSVVTFVQSASDSTVWLASSAQQILPGAGGKPSPGLQVSWDSQGRLASIADQSSIDSSGKPTRVAHFYYGGDSQCASAPPGLLCAFENLDATMGQVSYNALSTSFGAYQIGQVALPGGAIWSFDWQTASYTLTDNTTVTAPQLLSVQTPSGHDAASAGTVGTDDSKWWVVYDPFFGELQGFVSPLPGAGPAANDRLGRYYTLASGANPGEAQIAWGTVSGSAPSTSLGPGAQLQRARALLQRLGLASAGNVNLSPEQLQRVRALLQRVGLGSASASGFSLSPGALLQRVGFDSAWRRTSVGIFLDANTSYTTSYSWDPALDLQTGVTFAGVTETQAYDFLGRLKTKNGPGAAVSTYEYDQDSLAGWTATIYNNDALSAPGVTSEAVNSAAVDWTSAPAGVTSGTWSMRLSTYLEAPAAGASVAYRLSSDGDAAATLWVNGECDPAPAPTTEPPLPTGPPDQAGPGLGSGCGNDNTATTSTATAVGDALNLVVQYVRNGAAVSAADPVSIQVEQQVNGGDWTALTLTDLDPGLDLQSTAASSDTLSPGGSAVTLSRTTAWEDPLFGTQTGVAYPGFSGDLVTTPAYEANYDPTNSQWKRLTSQTSAGGSTYGVGYWDNAATPTSPLCSDTEDVIQAGQVQMLTYPDPSSGAAGGLSRQLAYDAAGRKAAVELVPAGVSGCLSYDARARKVAAQVSAYSGIGPLSEAWAYSPDGLTTTITHTFGAPTAKPACATESSAPYTCTESQTVDLLGRTVARTDVWGTAVATDYQLDPATGVQTTTTTTTTTATTATTTRSYNRDGNPATLTRTDTAGSPTLSAAWSYDSFGRTHSIETDSGTAEVITATYGYDDQSRVDSLTWSQNGSPVVTNSLTLSPNSTRTLGETIGVGGKTYDFAYSFNTAGWLTGAELTGGLSAAWDYAFDTASFGTNLNAQLNGNVTTYSATVGTNSQTLALGYDYLDRIAATSADPAGTTIAHDALGNLTGYGNLQLTYNQTDQLIEAADGTTTVSFDRTPNGDLYGKVTSNGTTTAIRYAAGNLILNDSGTATFQTLLIGNLLATIDLADSSQSGYALTTLQGGNALLTLDATGSPQNLSSPSLYGPWGEVINPPTADPAKPLYGWQAGNLLETTAGLVLMGERTYLPALGRFTSLDPAFGGGINGYNYAANDPINNNDPNGRLSQSTKNALEIGGVVVGGVVVGTGVGVGLAKLFAPSEPIAQANAPELNVGPSNLEGTAEGTADVVDLNIAGNEINQLSEGVNDPALEASDGMFEGLQGGVDDAFLEALEAGGLL